MATNPVIPCEQPFVLLSGVNQNYAIQAGSVSGSSLTLQPFDDSFSTLTQQFVLRMQNNLDPNGNRLASGVAFVNLGTLTPGSNPPTFCSVASGGLEMPLTVQPYIPPSFGGHDAWGMYDALAFGTVGIRITSPGNPSWSWNDLGGKGKAGDKIGLWDEQSSSSVWIVALANLMTTDGSNKRAANRILEPAMAQ